MRDSGYHQLVRELIQTIPDIVSTLLSMFPSMSKDQRKAVVTLCRSQIEVYPEEGTSLATRLESLSPSVISLITEVCEDPLYAGFLITMVRSAPYSSREIRDIYAESADKELRVMIREPRRPRLNYNCLFSSSCEPLCDEIPYNAKMSKYVREVIYEWIRSMNGKVVYPKMSSKSVSQSTRRLAAEVLDTNYYSDRITSEDLERIYHRTGHIIGGVCEMRQVWNPSDLDPRTYYAMGGEAFRKSTYVGRMIGDLCDLIPSCNRYLSVNPNRLMLEHEDHFAYLYDLASFTSNLHEHYSFMTRLAEACTDIWVTIVDAWNGPQQCLLSDLLYDYATLCKDIPVDLRRVYHLDITVQNRCAGLLGVYANITSAKFIHTVVMLQTVQSTDAINVAGDDGVISTDNTSQKYDSIVTLGEMQMQKTYRTDEPGLSPLEAAH